MSFAYAKASQNLIHSAIVTSDPYSDSFPADNMGRLPLSKKGRVPLTAATAKIHITFPAAVTVDTFSILHHNISETGTISVKGGSSYDPSTELFTMDWAKKNIHKCYNSTFSHKYWTIEITDDANLHGFISIGYLFFVERTALSFSFLASHRRRTIQSAATGMTESEDDKISSVGSRDTYVLPFDSLNETQKDTLEALCDDVEESDEPVLLFPEDSEQEGILGRLEQDNSIRFQAGPVAASDKVFVEDPPTPISPTALPIIKAGEPLPKGFTFSRASTAYYKNKDLQLVEAAVDEWRNSHYLDYGVETILQEPAETNLFLYSEDFSNAAWTKSGATVSVNQADEPVVNPSGLMDELIEDSSSASHRAYQEITITADEAVSATIFAEENTRSWIRIVIYDPSASTNQINAWFDLSTGTVGTVSNGGTGLNARAMIERMVGGVWRCYLAGNVGNGATAVRVQYALATQDAEASYQGDGSSSLYIWGAHASQQGFSGSYVATTTAPVTRSKDVMTTPWSYEGPFSFLYDCVEIGFRHTSLSRVFQIANVGVNSNPRVLLYNSSGYRFNYIVVSGLSSQAVLPFESLGTNFEFRGVIDSAGMSWAWLSSEGGAESVNSGTARGLAYYGNELSVGLSNDGGNSGLLCYRKLVFRRMIQSREFLRSL